MTESIRPQFGIRLANPVINLRITWGTNTDSSVSSGQKNQG